MIALREVCSITKVSTQVLLLGYVWAIDPRECYPKEFRQQSRRVFVTYKL